MDKQFAGKLDTQISRYKQALTYFAKTCDWEVFKLNASTLFDYLESVELYLVKRKFHHLLEIIFMALVLALVLFSALGNSLSPTLIRYRSPLGLTAVSGFLVEMILLFELRLYMNVKTSHQKERKEQFIRNIEDDFRIQLGADSCRMGK